jgi:hypothetical protein
MARLSAMADVGLSAPSRSLATSTDPPDDLVRRDRDRSWTLPDGSLVDQTLYDSDFGDRPFASVQGTHDTRHTTDDTRS